MKPLFIFSLPRSGSTLLQRLLATHPEIVTVPEPWILLPFLYASRCKGVFAEYNHFESVLAIKEFCARLPDGHITYREELRSFVSRLYAKQSPANSKYFLDKTPRYHLVADEIMELFPDAKFIFLWRNPLAILASMIDTWGSGRWVVDSVKIDLYAGLDSLVSAYGQCGERACSVRFEDLLTEPERQLKQILDYLDLPFHAHILTGFQDIKMDSRMGDPTGTRLYSQVNREPIDKWLRTMANPLRKVWCRRYLKWIGNTKLELMGYNIDYLLDKLKTTPGSFRFLGSDTLRMPLGMVSSLFETYIFMHKLHMLLKGRKLYSHR